MVFEVLHQFTQTKASQTRFEIAFRFESFRYGWPEVIDLDANTNTNTDNNTNGNTKTKCNFRYGWPEGVDLDAKASPVPLLPPRVPTFEPGEAGLRQRQ